MGHKSLKDTANPSQLGDPVSLKAETSDNIPKPSEGGAEKSGSLKESAEKALKNNPSALGDPISLKAETSDHMPTKEEAGAKTNNGKPKI